MLKYEKSTVFFALVTRSHFEFHAITLSVWRRTSAGPEADALSWAKASSMFFGSPMPSSIAFVSTASGAFASFAWALAWNRSVAAFVAAAKLGATFDLNAASVALS